eukprot:2744040-Alexandrium_andersonii.AAC.1
MEGSTLDCACPSCARMPPTSCMLGSRLAVVGVLALFRLCAPLRPRSGLGAYAPARLPMPRSIGWEGL